MTKPVIILGGGGHAKVLLEVLILQKIEVYGFTDPNKNKELSLGNKNIKYLGKDEVIKQLSPINYNLVNGLGSVGIDTLKRRREKYKEFQALHFKFLNVIHPASIVSEDVAEVIRSKEGVQVMAGANIRPGSNIGDNTIINTGVSVDHDCNIGSHVHVAPGVVMSGEVDMGDSCHIGTGSLIRNGIKIGCDVFVSMGCVVTENQKEGTIVNRPKIGGLRETNE